MNNLFSVFELIAGVYLLYGAITGKGQIYQNENIKKGMEEQYHKTIRICCAIVGPIMLTQGVLDYLYVSSPSPALQTATSVLLAASMLGVAVLFFLTIRMTDRAKVKRQRQGKSAAPRAAFEFEEEDRKASLSNNKPGKGNKEN